MRFDIGLFETVTGIESACLVDIDQELARMLLKYKPLVETVDLPFVFLVVAKPDPAHLIIESGWQRAIGLEEFAIKPSGVHLNVLDEDGCALSTEAIGWDLLEKIAG